MQKLVDSVFFQLRQKDKKNDARNTELKKIKSGLNWKMLNLGFTSH